MSDISKPENTLSRRETLALGGAAALFPFAASRVSGAIQTPATEEVHYKSLRDTSRLIAANEVSALDLTHHMQDRIGRLDPILKSYATVMGDQAVADAQVASEAIRRGESVLCRIAAAYEHATAWHDRHPGTI